MALKHGIDAITKTMRIGSLIVSGIALALAASSSKDALVIAGFLSIVLIVSAWLIAWIIDKFAQ